MSGFLIDTNVVSEGIKPRTSPEVAAWISRQEPADIYLSTIVVGELRAGIEKLPQGKRRRGLDEWCNNLITVVFEERILDFDLAAAEAYGRLVAKARSTGRPAHMADAQIAAVAAVHGLTVATRDTADFAGFGIALANPFAAA